MDGEHRSLLLEAEPGEAADLGREEVVARDHDQVVVEPRALDHEADVPDRAEPVVLARRPVVDHRHGVRRPRLEVRRELRVRDDVHAVDVRRPQRVEDVMRPASFEPRVFQLVIHVPAIVFQHQRDPVPPEVSIRPQRVGSGNR